MSGTAITVAFYNTNIRDNLNWLRQNTGGGFDPTGSGQILRSTGVAATEWTSSPTIAGNLTLTGFLNVGTNLSVPGTSTLTGNVTMNGAASVNGGDFSLASTRLIVFAAEQNEKIRLDGTTHAIGTAANTVYVRAPTTVQFRDSGGTTQVQMNLSGTPSMTVGGNTVALLNSANFTTLQQGGNNVLTTATARATTGTYSGNGVTTNRLISVSFQPTFAIIAGGNADGNIEMLMVHSTGGSARSVNSGNVTFSGAVKLDPNGILVGAGSNHGNASGVSYAWAAFP